MEIGGDAQADSGATRSISSAILMGKVRKIDVQPRSGRNCYLVDSNFLANKFIPPAFAPVGLQRSRITACHDWWAEIEEQLTRQHARVYIPDVCIAEAFKVLAKKYYSEKWFTQPVRFHQAKQQLSEFVRVSPRTLRAKQRNIRVHDISTNRDIVVSVDRFFELFFKHKKQVQIADLILASTAKYLLDFFDIPKTSLHIVTLDRHLREGIAKAPDLPPAYDPTLKSHRAAVVFRTPVPVQ
jgi:predicted nucleic acid-binding protein